MPSIRRVLPVLALALIPVAGRAQVPESAARVAIDSFNVAFANATRQMDNAATMALWEDGGVSLLPATKPIVGKAAIGKSFADAVAPLAGAHMDKFESRCSDIHVAGDWASEWCFEHQVVVLPGNKPPFDGWGKMLLVLHRGADGHWRLKDEMWNQGVPGEFTPE